MLILSFTFDQFDFIFIIFSNFAIFFKNHTCVSVCVVAIYVGNGNACMFHVYSSLYMAKMTRRVIDFSSLLLRCVKMK